MSDRIAVMNQGKLVEVGTAEQVYHEPKDEYTKALFAAVPVPDPRRQRERRPSVPGSARSSAKPSPATQLSRVLDHQEVLS